MEEIIKSEIERFFECLTIQCQENSELDSDEHRRAYLEHYLRNFEYKGE